MENVYSPAEKYDAKIHTLQTAVSVYDKDHAAEFYVL